MRLGYCRSEWKLAERRGNVRGLRRVCQPFQDGDDPSDVVWAGGKDRIDAGNTVGRLNRLDVKSVHTGFSEFSVETRR